MSSQCNIRNTPFDHKSPQPPEEGVLRCHNQTNKQTDRRTSLLYDWIIPVGRSSQNHSGVTEVLKAEETKLAQKNAISPFFDARANKNIGTTICIGWEILCLLYAGYSPTWLSGSSCSSSCDVRVCIYIYIFCPLFMYFFWVVRLVRSVPLPWTVADRASPSRSQSQSQSQSQSLFCIVIALISSVRGLLPCVNGTSYEADNFSIC